jgi:hypothetical protein
MHINLKLYTQSALGKIVVINKSITPKQYYQDEQKNHAGNPKLWEDWERLLSWILKRSDKNGKIDRSKLRKALKVVRKSVGKKAKGK